MADDTAADSPDATILKAIHEYKAEARTARQDRIAQSQNNRNAYLGRQDWSHKLKGQSTEFLPKTGNAVEQMAAFIKKALVQFGDWFSIRLDRSLDIDPTQISNIMKVWLNNIYQGNGTYTTFPLLLSDGMKVGLLESLMIFKVHGEVVSKRTYKMVAKGKKRTMEESEEEEWQLRIDLVAPEDYYPDPTGRGLYEIHETEKDLADIVAQSEGEDALYKKSVVDMLRTDYTLDESDKRRDEARNQVEAPAPANRKRVKITEFWGTILDLDGRVMHRNVVCTIANDKHIIRPPEPNPFWHGRSPLVSIPIIRVPFSVWHRALFDDAVGLNLAMNELFSLMVDGALGSVWGIKQLRHEELENPSDVENGIPMGKTLNVKSTLGAGAKVLETVAESEVPPDAMNMYEALNREFLAAALTNETKQGSLPQRQVLATEIIEASQSQATTLDGVVTDLESSLNRLLEMCWYNILQNMDRIPVDTLDDLVDRQVATIISDASPEERFTTFFGKTKFQAFGLSATMGRAQQFQKMVAMLQLTKDNPLMLRAFILKFSADKALRTLMRALNLNVDDLSKDKDEEAQVAQEMQEAGAAAQTMDPAAGGMAAPGAEAGGAGGAPPGGGSDTASEVNQLTNTRTGMPANA